MYMHTRNLTAGDEKIKRICKNVLRMQHSTKIDFGPR